MATTSPTHSSADADKRSQAFKALLEIIVSGGDDHPKLSRMLSTVAGSDRGDWISKSVLFTSAAAYEIVKRGVPSRSLIAIGNYLGIGRGALADLVDMDRATASRRIASDQPLPLHAAESVLRLLELQCLAEDTFSTLEAASVWLRREHPMLDNKAPLDWAKSAYGAERVKEILIALKYSGAV